jgi:hypothetical protein
VRQAVFLLFSKENKDSPGRRSYFIDLAVSGLSPEEGGAYVPLFRLWFVAGKERLLHRCVSGVLTCQNVLMKKRS